LQVLHPGVLQPLDPTPAGAGGQADPLGDLGDGQAGVVLDQVQNLGINRIKGLGHAFLPNFPHMRPVRALEPDVRGTP